MATRFLPLGTFVRVALLSILFLLLAMGLLTSIYSEFPSTRMLLARTDVVVLPATKVVGDVPAGENLSIQFTVENRSNMPVAIVGVTGMCECRMRPSIPFELAAGESRTILMSYRAPEDIGNFRKVVSFVTASNATRLVQLQLKGNVLK